MKKAIAFGDSVLKGVIIDSARTIANNVRYMFLDSNFTSQAGARLGVYIDNYGKFGSTISIGTGIVDRHIKQVGDYDYTFLEYGGNDSDFDWSAIAADPLSHHEPRTPLKLFSEIYTCIVDKVRKSGSKPVMLSLTPLDPEMYFSHFTRNMNQEQKDNVISWLGGTTESITSWHEMYNLEVFKLSSRLGVPLLDITTPFLSCKDFRQYYCEDGIHPNAQGHHLIADAICDQIAIH